MTDADKLKICLLVEQYAITVVRSHRVPDDDKCRLCTVVLSEYLMDDVFEEGVVWEEVVDSMQILLADQFPHVLGFQTFGSDSIVVENLHTQFENGDTIFQILHTKVKQQPHWVCCFARDRVLYYICSANFTPTALVKRRLAEIFCAPGSRSPITVQVIKVVQQDDQECGCRTAAAGALLCSGMSVDEFSRVVPPLVKRQYKDLEQCLVEGHWRPQWAENPEYLAAAPPRGSPLTIEWAG